MFTNLNLRFAPLLIMRKDMRSELLLALLLVGTTYGCSSRQGMKVVDINDAKGATWADPRQSFQPTEEILLHIAGYGGRKVTVELWREPEVLLHRATHDIPARKIYRTYDRGVFIERWGYMIPARRETFHWTSTDYMLRLKPLPPGHYELRLHADDGRKESTKFIVQGYGSPVSPLQEQVTDAKTNTRD